MKVFADDLPYLSSGAVFLATGGGGDPHVAYLTTHQVLTKSGGVELINVDDLKDEDYVVTIGGVGAPTVSLELLPSISAPGNVLSLFEKHVGRHVDAVVSFEIGGGNSMIPMIAAAQRGIPVVDGDGMGRALPEAQMMTYPIAGVKPTPAVALDYAGNVATFETDSTTTYERHIRSITTAMGGMITAAEHPMTGSHSSSPPLSPIPCRFPSRSEKCCSQNRGSAHEIFTPLKTVFSNSIYGELFHLYTGKVIDYTSRIVGGYDVGKAVIQSFGNDTPNLEVAIKNEYLVATVDGQVLASVPDLIVMLDYETSTPINAERLRYGQRVSVFAVGCPEYYRKPRALNVVAPRCFGFDFDFVPVEQLVGLHQEMG